MDFLKLIGAVLLVSVAFSALLSIGTVVVWMAAGAVLTFLALSAIGSGK